MKRFNLRRNIFSAAGQTLLQTVLLFALYRFLLDAIGVEKFGIWSVVLATASVSQVGNFGFAGSVTKFVAQYGARGEHEAVAQVIQTGLLSIMAFLGVLLLAASPALSALLRWVLPANALEQGRDILPFALFSLWLTAATGVLQSGLDGVFRTDYRAVVNVVGSLFYFLSAVVCVKWNGLMGLALAQNIQAVLVLLLTWVCLRKAVAGLPYVPSRWSFAYFKEMLGYGVNLQVNTVALMLFEPTVKALLSRYDGIAMAGYFEMALRAVMRVRSTLIEINRILVPVFADFAEGDKRSAELLYKRNVESLFSVATPLFAALLGLAPAISELWLGAYQRTFTAMLGALSMAWYVNVLCSPAYFAYLGSGRLRWNSISHILMGLLNLFLGLILGQAYGGAGVVLAFVLAITLGSLICPAAYHVEQKLHLAPILSGAEYKMGGLCTLGAMLALAFYFELRGVSGNGLTYAHILLPLCVVTLMCGLSLVQHPVGRRAISQFSRQMK